MNPLRTKILATGSAFPKYRCSNKELAQNIETSDEWIFERTGIRARRIAKNGETNSSLAIEAAKQALSRAGIAASQLECILFATVTPDFIMPNTACLVQEKLGATKASAFDLSAACSGFVYGLEIADSLIRSGKYKNVLLIGAEVLSPIINWKDRTTCILFGDGAGAVVLGNTSSASLQDSQILSTHLYSDGSLKELLHVPCSGSACALTAENLEKGLQYVHMKGKEIYKVAIRCMADAATEALRANHLTIYDVDWVIPHQANLRIIEAVAKRLEISMDKFILNIEEYANTSSATVPTALDFGVQSGKIKSGDLVLLTVFGAGLTYGSALIRY